MRTLVTGASGFIGSHLIPHLDDPVILTRNVERAQSQWKGDSLSFFEWNPAEMAPPREAFEGVEGVVHLAGEPLASGRWTAAKKRRLYESRVGGTKHLVEGLLALENRPKVLIAASAIGYYGDRGEEILDEASAPADDFLGKMCQDWEAAAKGAEEGEIRVISVRIGIVLGRGGGALENMLPPFRRGLGAPLGNGRQIMPWIHVEDLVALFLFLAEKEVISGPVNGVSPEKTSNRTFTKTLARALHRPAIFPAIPGFMLRLMLGQFGEVLLQSQIIEPKVALAHNFTFQYPQLEPALNNLLSSD